MDINFLHYTMFYLKYRISLTIISLFRFQFNMILETTQTHSIVSLLDRLSYEFFSQEEAELMSNVNYITDPNAAQIKCRYLLRSFDILISNDRHKLNNLDMYTKAYILGGLSRHFPI